MFWVDKLGFFTVHYGCTNLEMNRSSRLSRNPRGRDFAMKETSVKFKNEGDNAISSSLGVTLFLQWQENQSMRNIASSYENHSVMIS